MKVLQVLPELNSGGVEEVTLNLAAFLCREGHQSLVLSNGGQLVPRLEASGSRHFTLPVHRKSPLSLLAIGRIRKLILTEQPDIIHLRSRVPAWLTYLAWKSIPRSQRPRLVSTVHGLYSTNFYSAIMTKGERVLCVSQAVKDYVLTHYPKTPAERLQVIYEGVAEDRYFPEFQVSEQWLKSWYEQFPKTNDRILLILPGRITRLKGHADFLHIISRLRENHPKIHGLIVGGAHPRKEAYLQEIKALTSELKLDDHITFTGSRTDLREILSLSDLSFSLSNQPESFGLTVLEALSLSTPVIGYNRGGVAEILEKLFPHGALEISTESESSRIERLVQKASTILDKPTAIQNNECFQSKKVHAQTVNCYQELRHDS